MKQTKLIAWMLVLIMLASVMAACNGNTTPADTTPAPGTDAPDPTNAGTEPEESSAPVEDGVPEEEKYGGTFVWAQTGDPNTLLYAWLTSGWTNRMASFINDKLLLIDNEGNITYRICDDVQVSEDNLVYTFHVREGVKWHDGTPVLASDIVWTHTVQFSPDWFMALQYVLPGTWETVDDSTFTVTLDTPDPTFLYQVMDNMIPQPEHYWADQEIANYFSCEKATKPIGCGPFKFVEYKVGEYLAMEAFEDFWNGRPYLDAAFIKITGSAQNTQIGFENGEISAITTTEDYYEEIKNDDRFQFLIGPSNSLVQIAFEGSPIKDICGRHDDPLYTGDPIIREAIAWALPYDEINDKIMRGASKRSYSMVCTDTQWYSEEGITKYTYDLDKANKLLDDAGYTDIDGNGIRNWKDGSDIKMKCTFYGAGSVNERLSVILVEQLTKLGFGAILSAEEMTTWVDSLLGEQEAIDPDSIKTSFSIYYYGGFGRLALDSVGQTTRNGAQSPYRDWGMQDSTGEVYPEEKLIEVFGEEHMALVTRVEELFDVIKTSDEETASKAFAEIQKIWMEDMKLAYGIPIGTMERRMGFQGNIRGIEDSMWPTNTNTLCYQMEKIWIEK